MLVDIIDLDTQRLLIDLYNQMEGKTEISIGAPNYDQSQIDIIIANKYTAPFLYAVCTLLLRKGTKNQKKRSIVDCSYLA